MRPEQIPTTAAEFLAWCEAESSSARYELIAGRAVRMMGESKWHGAAKRMLTRRLLAAIPSGGICEVHLDGMALQCAEDSVFEPDAFIACGEENRTPGAAFADASVVFEILSDSTRRRDLEQKTPAYLALPSVVAVALIDIRAGAAFVFRRETGPDVAHIVKRSGALRFDLPSGVLEIALEPIFEQAEPLLPD